MIDIISKKIQNHHGDTRIIISTSEAQLMGLLDMPEFMMTVNVGYRVFFCRKKHKNRYHIGSIIFRIEDMDGGFIDRLIAIEENLDIYS